MNRSHQGNPKKKQQKKVGSSASTNPIKQKSNALQGENVSTSSDSSREPSPINNESLEVEGQPIEDQNKVDTLSDDIIEIEKKPIDLIEEENSTLSSSDETLIEQDQGCSTPNERQDVMSPNTESHYATPDGQSRTEADDTDNEVEDINSGAATPAIDADSQRKSLHASSESLESGSKNVSDEENTSGTYSRKPNDVECCANPKKDEGVAYPTEKSKSKSPFANYSKGDKALVGFTVLSVATFAASLISSLLEKPLCPNRQGNLISLMVLGTIATISTVVSLAHFCCPSKSKGGEPSSKLGGSEVTEVLQKEKLA